MSFFSNNIEEMTDSSTGVRCWIPVRHPWYNDVLETIVMHSPTDFAIGYMTATSRYEGWDIEEEQPDEPDVDDSGAVD